MQNTPQQFIQLCLARNILRFGDFILKSGRKSPYFINTGLFNQGNDLLALGRFYAELIHHSNIEFDVLFGPAYKGIPLVSVTALMLAEHFNCNKPYAFNRKEAKNHGEGGMLVGADVTGKRVLILDDLITAGTAIRQSHELLTHADATVAGIALAIDRQEKGYGERSAVQEISHDLSCPVLSIIKLADIIHYLDAENSEHLSAIKTYQAHYGISD